MHISRRRGWLECGSLKEAFVFFFLSSFMSQLERSRALVVRRLRLLPFFPFRGAAAAVCQLRNTPLGEAPSLHTLCTTSIPGFTAEEGLKLFDATAHLHPRHQLPYVLSRVAASTAIGSLAIHGNEKVVFTGSRQSARALHGCELSLSHEDGVGAAVAWLPDAPMPQGSTSNSLSLSSSAALLKEDFLVHPACGGCGEKRPRLVCAIDVCPVAEIHRVRLRFPQLRQRWMPQCEADAPADAVHAALLSLQQPVATPVRSSDVVSVEAREQSRRREWWQQLRQPCVDESDAYTSLVLAQHWGARECLVKLLGVPGRSFSYQCVQHDPRSTSAVSHPSVQPFTAAFLRPHTLYQGLIGGCEAPVWERAGLNPVVHLYTWVEWYAHSEACDLPCVVVAASCIAQEPRHTGLETT